MDILLLALLLSIGIFVLNGKQQRQRIGLLASHLAQYQIEKLLENLIEGYMRALGETDPARRQQIWDLLRTTELQLSEQFGQLATEMARVDAALTRVSTLPLALPFADQWWPSASFDLRQAFKIHAEGIERAVRNDAQRAPKDKAFTLKIDERCFELGLIVRPLGDLCVISPPLVITRAQIDDMVAILARAIAEVGAAHGLKAKDPAAV